MQLAWLTDIHLNFLRTDELSAFLADLRECRVDAYLISGDIGEAHSIEEYLKALVDHLPSPIYFVLGNHDYYRASTAWVHRRVATLAQQHPGLCWLSRAGSVRLTDSTALVGHESWADGGYGNYGRSPVELNDHYLIADLAGLSRPARLEQMQSLAGRTTDRIRRDLVKSFHDRRRAILVTHVPPFAEVSVYRGRQGSDQFLPFYASKVLGDMLLKLMRARPNHHLTVLCGHTHFAAQRKMLPNLEVIVGGTTYGSPRIQQVIEIE